MSSDGSKETDISSSASKLLPNYVTTPVQEEPHHRHHEMSIHHHHHHHEELKKCPAVAPPSSTSAALLSKTPNNTTTSTTTINKIKSVVDPPDSDDVMAYDSLEIALDKKRIHTRKVKLAAQNLTKAKERYEAISQTFQNDWDMVSEQYEKQIQIAKQQRDRKWDQLKANKERFQQNFDRAQSILQSEQFNHDHWQDLINKQIDILKKLGEENITIHEEEEEEEDIVDVDVVLEESDPTRISSSSPSSPSPQPHHHHQKKRKRIENAEEGEATGVQQKHHHHNTRPAKKKQNTKKNNAVVAKATAARATGDDVETAEKIYVEEVKKRMVEFSREYVSKKCIEAGILQNNSNNNCGGPLILLQRNAVCHICHKRQNIVGSFACGIQSHSYCKMHLKNHIGISVGSINDKLSFDHCPICAVTCVCSKCRRKTNKLAIQLKKKSQEQGGVSPSMTVFDTMITCCTKPSVMNRNIRFGAAAAATTKSKPKPSAIVAGAPPPPPSQQQQQQQRTTAATTGLSSSAPPSYHITAAFLPLGCPYMTCPATTCSKIQFIPTTSKEEDWYKRLLKTSKPDNNGRLKVDMTIRHHDNSTNCKNFRMSAGILRHHVLKNCEAYRNQLGRKPEVTDLPNALRP